jgi:hypothetical protein
MSPLPSITILLELSTCQVLRKAQFAFLGFQSTAAINSFGGCFKRHVGGEKEQIQLNYLPTCERIERFIPIDQDAGGLSAESALIAFHDNLKYFF